MDTPLSIHVLVDALGWEIVRQRSFLDDVLPERRWLTTILGDSSGAIPTLLSGRMPSQHGHWSRFYLDAERSPFRWTRGLASVPRALVDNRVTRGALEAAARRLSGYSGAFSLHDYPIAHLPYFDLTEKRDVYQPGGLDTPSLFDVFRGHALPYECYSARGHTDAQILELATHRAAISNARVLFLALSGLDAELHRHIPDADRVTRALHWYETGLRRIWHAATRARRDVRMFVFSDHGMTPIRWTCDLRRDVATLGLSVPADYLPAYEPTMARFWVWNDRARRVLAEFLAEHPCGHLMTPGELQRLGVDFDDGRYYHLLFLLKPGMLLCPSDVSRTRVAGMHGYHPSEPTADAVLLASVPVGRGVDHISGVHDVLLEDAGLRQQSPRPDVASAAVEAAA